MHSVLHLLHSKREGRLPSVECHVGWHEPPLGWKILPPHQRPPHSYHLLESHLHFEARNWLKAWAVEDPKRKHVWLEGVFILFLTQLIFNLLFPRFWSDDGGRALWTNTGRSSQKEGKPWATRASSLDWQCLREFRFTRGSLDQSIIRLFLFVLWGVKVISISTIQR